MTEEEAEKRALHKLLREYDSNRGMASFVCSYPVELMPESEQSRMLSGYSTPENLEILSISREKFVLAKNLDLDESELEKVSRAIGVLDTLHKAFNAYREKKLNDVELCKQVRELLTNPIPETQEGLIDAFPHILETIDFLSKQPLDSKDSWDRKVDAVQMYEALSRARDVCIAMEKHGKSGDAMRRTRALAEKNINHLERFFKKATEEELTKELFQEIGTSLKAIWEESERSEGE